LVFTINTTLGALAPVEEEALVGGPDYASLGPAFVTSPVSAVLTIKGLSFNFGSEGSSSVALAARDGSRIADLIIDPSSGYININLLSASHLLPVSIFEPFQADLSHSTDPTFSTAILGLGGNGGNDVLGSFLPSSVIISVNPSVPEPSTWAMLLIGFAGIGFMIYRRRLLPRNEIGV
jgi:hypothetical protein